MCVKNRLSYHENKIKVSIQQLSLTFNMLHWFKLDCVSTVLSFPSLHSFLLRYQSLKKFKISFVLVCIKPYHICRYFNSPSFSVLIFKNGQLVEVKPKLSNIKLIIFATLFNHLGSSFPLLKVGSEYFLKKMSCLLTTRLTMQEGQSQSWPSAGHDFATLPSSP